MTKPTVLLMGASGQIGVFLIPRLLKTGMRVLAVSRKGQPEGYPDINGLTWLKDAVNRPPEESCDYLISAGPLALALDVLASDSRIHSAVVFSSSSVISKQASTNPKERKQIQDMLSIEARLDSILEGRTLKLVILKPTMIYGCGLDTNISRLARWIRRFGFMPVNGKAKGLRQPVHAGDLAEVAVAALTTSTPLPRSLVLAGGSTLTFRELVIGIFSAMGKPARILQLPEWLFVLLLRLKPGSDINTEMVRRQCVDLTFDDQQARQLLAYDPRPFSPSEKDFKLPGFP